MKRRWICKKILLVITALTVLFSAACVHEDTMPVYVPDPPTAPSEQATEPTWENVTDTVLPESDFDQSGFFTSDTGTDLVLRMDWRVKQDPTDFKVNVDVRLTLEFKGELNVEEIKNNTLLVGDESVTFTTDPVYGNSDDGSSELLFTYSTSAARPKGEDVDIYLCAKYFIGTEYDGEYYKNLLCRGTVRVADRNTPTCASVDVPLAYQYPQLPNGCEVTSLSMALQYLGYDTDKMELKNEYLPIGEDNFYEFNIGDPEFFGSYGCYSPVILRTARNYLSAKGGGHEAVDLTHFNIDEIYYEVSAGHPVVVWITQNIYEQPYIIESWEWNGLTFNWKAPLHCVVLSGYDKDSGIVTLADPIYGVVERDMDLFELRWHQMGEQAIVIK